MEAKKINVALGTMAFGDALNVDAGKQVLDFFEKNVDIVDTAIMYQYGKTEITLGEIRVSDRFKIATKANPFYDLDTAVTTSAPKCGLSRVALQKQLNDSLSNLKIKKVDIFYLHWPDHVTHIEETLEAVHELDQEGKFIELGLSNYSAWQVTEIYYICKSKGWKLPTVYQGMYNYVTRNVEPELFPVLRRFGIRFYAYNPLAGGILTGRYSFTETPTNGRFNQNTDWGKKYTNRFWKQDLFETIDNLKSLCEEHNITLIDVAFSWLCHHSKLINNDAIIIGGSSLDHFQINYNAIKNSKPLPKEILEIVDQGWTQSKAECASYFR